MKDVAILALASSLFFAAGCSQRDDRIPLEGYYFPIEALKKTDKVYVYVSPTTGDTEYWRYHAEQTDTGAVLTATFYDRQFQKGQTMVEAIHPSGSVAKSLTLFHLDSVTRQIIPVVATLEAGNVFPFFVRDTSGIFLYKTAYPSWDEAGATIYLIRNRRYIGHKPEFSVDGKSSPCIGFAIKEIVGNKSEGAAEIEGVGEEHYAQGVGLVYYKKAYSSAKIVFESRLTEIISVEEFEKRKADKG